jgi:hypothetical protein
MTDTNQTAMGDWDDTPLYDPRATWPEGKSDHALRITEVNTITTDPKEGLATGWEIKKVKLEVANGDLAGKNLFMDFLVTPAMNEKGEVVPKEEKVVKLMADGLDRDEAYEKAQSNIIGFAKGERQKYLRLMNAAGFIREQDVKSGDKNMRRIEGEINGAVKLRNTENGYEIVGTDGNTTGTVFTDDMLVTRIVMGTTKPEKYKDKDGNEKTGRAVAKVWDYDPSEVGELAESVAF